MTPHSAADPTRDDLKALAAEPDPRAPRFTRAGRAPQKHGYRPSGSVFPRVVGPPAFYNSAATQIVSSILDDPATVVVTRLKRRNGQMLPVVEVIARDGRKLGYLWDPDNRRYSFDGLREP